MSNSLAAKLVQPANIAIFASVGIHAVLLGVVLPNLHNSKQENSTRRTVPLIELSPLEQTRLPDFSPPLPETPPFPNTPLDSGINPSFLPPPSTPNYPNDSSITSFYPDLPSVPLPPPPPQITFPPVAKIDPLPPPQQTLPSTPTKTPVVPSTSASESKKSPNTQTNETKPKTPTKSSPTTIAVVRQQRLVADIRLLGNSLQKNETDTTEQEARKNYNNWLKSIKAEKAQNLKIAGTYPKDACIRKLEGTTEYGVVVNPEGKVSNLELIRSAGYPVFNQQALQNITNRSFENKTGKPQPHRVEVNFQYDRKICPSLSLPAVETAKTPNQEAKPQQSTPIETPSASPTTQTPKKPNQETKPRQSTAIETPKKPKTPTEETSVTPPASPAPRKAPKSPRETPAQMLKPRSQTGVETPKTPKPTVKIPKAPLEIPQRRETETRKKSL